MFILEWNVKKYSLETSILDLSDYIDKAKEYGRTRDYPKFNTSEIDYNKQPNINGKNNHGEIVKFFDPCKEDDFLITKQEIQETGEDGGLVISRKYRLNEEYKQLEKIKKKEEKRISARGHSLNMSALFTDIKSKEKRILDNINEEFYTNLRKKFNNKLLSIDFYKPKNRELVQDRKRIDRERKLENHRVSINTLNTNKVKLKDHETKSILQKNIDRDLKRIVEIDNIINGKFEEINKSTKNQADKCKAESKFFSKTEVKDIEDRILGPFSFKIEKKLVV